MPYAIGDFAKLPMTLLEPAFRGRDHELTCGIFTG
jgi:hypothetical protein